jgi:NitT/TauT family transport system permease protein
VLVLGIWQGAASARWIDPIFLPSPLVVFHTLWSMTVHGQILGNAAVSLWRIFAAFALSVVMAIPIGMVMGGYRPVNAALEPLIDFVRYLPTPALVPISIIWFGVGEETKIFLLWLGTFFQLVLLVVEDMNRVPQEYVEIALTLGAPPRAILTDIAWRAMMPSLFDNLRITLGWCWTYLIIAEIVAADSGLGFVIWTARRYMQTDQVMAGVMAIGLIGLATDQGLRALHRVLFRYLP